MDRLPSMEHVAIVTDSTAYLPADLLATHGIRVVPVQVVVSGQPFDEGTEISPAEVAEALRAWLAQLDARLAHRLLARERQSLYRAEVLDRWLARR